MATQYSCLEKSHGQRSLVGCSPWGLWESGTTEQLHFHFLLSCIGGGNGNPLQCSCLENPRDRGAWWAAHYGVTQSRTRLNRLSSSSSHRVSPHGNIWTWVLSPKGNSSRFHTSCWLTETVKKYHTHPNFIIKKKRKIIWPPNYDQSNRMILPSTRAEFSGNETKMEEEIKNLGYL